MKRIHPFWMDVLFSLIFAVVVGVGIAAFSPGNFMNGWIGGGLLSALCFISLRRTWRYFDSSKILTILMVTSFLVRVVLGIFLQKGLPVFGYDNPVQNAGYSYSDAYTRDQAAFQLATENKNWLSPLQATTSSDQYGGLLFISSIIYRVFSSDAHRPLLMVLISAFMMTLGLAFFYGGVRKRWGSGVGLAAGWVFAVYPDGIFLGSSQMREPLLIGFTCIAFWEVLRWKEKPIQTLLISFSATALALFISIPAGLAVVAILVGVLILDWAVQVQDKARKWIGVCIFVLFIGIVGFAGWLWLKQTLYFDAFITESSSGWITELISKLGKQWRIPFVTIYGLTQPLLPAALIDPSLPIWMGIAIFRAFGWYFVLPFLIYGFFAVLKERKAENAHLLIWLTFVFLAWTVISSARAGGDQWDNPRYRTIFLPWMALMVGWVWQRIRSHRSAWFWRWFAVEAIFVLFFLNWYINRQYAVGTQLPFFVMIGLIGGISGIILIGGVLFDFYHNKKEISKSLNSEQ